jgi:hypothetical protein
VTPVLPAISVRRARALVVAGRILSCTLLTLGILGMLRTSLDETMDLLVFTVHPLTAVVWLVLGVVGAAMSVTARWAQIYLTAAGVLLLVWAILGLALDGSPSGLFARDPELVALHLVAGVLALAVAVGPPVSRVERVVG